MVYMVLTVWQVIPCWRVWCLQNVQPLRSKKEEAKENLSERKAV